VQAAAAPETTLRAMLISLVVGAAPARAFTRFSVHPVQRSQSETNQQ
jgi:hypothetical protein